MTLKRSVCTHTRNPPLRPVRRGVLMKASTRTSATPYLSVSPVHLIGRPISLTQALHEVASSGLPAQQHVTHIQRKTTHLHDRHCVSAYGATAQNDKYYAQRTASGLTLRASLISCCMDSSSRTRAYLRLSCRQRSDHTDHVPSRRLICH